MIPVMENAETPVAENFEVEVVQLDSLKPHPRNYVGHPDDEIEHIMESIRLHGIYKNVVVARDGTLLAGHATVKAALRLGMVTIPVKRKDYGPDDPQAIALLVADNNIAHWAEVDDRALTELVKELREGETNLLLGSGFDDMQLANLVYVTRNSDEIADFDAAKHWVGLPEYEEGDEERAGLRLNLHFDSEADRARCMEVLGMTAANLQGSRWSGWWPARGYDDLRAVRFNSEPGAEPADA